MNRESFSKGIKKMQYGLKKHSPDIFIGIGISGMIGTAIMAAKATPKAIMIMEELEQNGNPDKKEIIKNVAPVYIPSAILCVVSASFILLANKIRIDRGAALATAYTFARDNLSDYRKKVAEKIGDKKSEEIDDDIARDKLEKNPVDNNGIISTNKGTHLCYDAVTGRYFYSDIEEIRKAVNDLNQTMLNENYVSLNDFHESIGLPPTELGDLLGWHVNYGLIDVTFSSQIAFNKEPCLVIMYTIAPGYNFDYEYLV